MNELWMIFVSIGIGSLIGGFTNYLAIKMLFRPLRPWFIGKWKVPFTPGLIPKRQDELAEQMGKMVDRYLFTSEGLIRRIRREDWQQDLLEKGRDLLQKIYHSEKTLNGWMEGFLSETTWRDWKRNIEKWLSAKGYDFVEGWLENKGGLTLKEILPYEMTEKREEWERNLQNYILHSLKKYVSSEEGELMISRTLSELLEGKGFFSSLFGKFFRDAKMTSLVQAQLLSLLEKEDMRNFIKEGIARLVNQSLEIRISQLQNWLGEEGIQKQVNQFAAFIVNLPIWERRLNQIPVQPFFQWLDERGISLFIQWVVNFLEQHMESLLSKVDVSSIVAEEVRSFPLIRLESMILDISGREFRMITNLGALLGGIIGLFQALLYLNFR
ncbi:DUF445 family protein [Microaerobacter geothermalis]|uniref:DUF445 domain-containing protein n=1 Tax=Microaerobacter geothermalis TaxID=674972 RepID=UPI001F1C9076|nr:DUF445 family protein [Microaerobacter geothermalis]MCF6094621.1 DUF445 family protein [Microaerobacter geothermalis]